MTVTLTQQAEALLAAIRPVHVERHGGGAVATDANIVKEALCCYAAFLLFTTKRNAALADAGFACAADKYFPALAYAEDVNHAHRKEPVEDENRGRGQAGGDPAAAG